MAVRRMFSKKITNSAHFLKMPASSRLLYYDLGMAADDDGVVEAFTVLRMSAASEDDLRILVSRGFVTLLNDDYVAYIEDWQENNYIRNDRYRESIYRDLLDAYLDGRQEGGKLPDAQKAAGSQEGPQEAAGSQETSPGAASQEAPQEAAGGQESPQGEAGDQTLVRLPMLDGSYYEVSRSQTESLAADFPDVDIGYEFGRMVTWFNTNPKKRREKKDMEQFIRRWLGRARDRIKKKGTQRERASAANRFNNFKQREYDFKELEKKLLNADKK